MKFRLPIIVLLGGVLVISLGILFYKSEGLFSNTKVEILESTVSGQLNSREITVEIAGEVLTPGVYKLPDGSRIDDLLNLAGGFTKDADNDWVEKYLNRASKITDGQKIYIPHLGESSANKKGVDQSGSGNILGVFGELVNINTANLSELDKLPGIGPTYAQKIVEQRPYSNIEELVNKKVIGKSLFEKIKNLISVY